MMNDPAYLRLVRHYEACFAEHGATAAGVDWPDEAGAKLRYDVMLDLLRWDPLKPEAPTLLDFGCGAAGLYSHVRCDELGRSLDYSGHDLSELYVAHCRVAYPEVRFTTGDILAGHQLDVVDYVVVNGVFTERLDLEHEEMFIFMRSILERLTAVARRGVAFNVMSSLVDWERDDLFHVPPSQIAELATVFGRRFLIRHDYPLYEYTTYLYR